MCIRDSLYASVVLPELTIGTEAAPTDWKSILSEYANIAYWGLEIGRAHV